MKDYETWLKQLIHGDRIDLLEPETEQAAAGFLEWLDQLSLEYQIDGSTVYIPGRIELLDSAEIRAGLSESVNSSMNQIETHFSIDSTNTYLMNKTGIADQKIACFAEQQSAGRGRRGRRWVSPFGANLYFSLHWPLSSSISTGGLSLAVGVAVAHALDRCGVSGVQLKWPNDVLLNGGKVGGILIEIKSSTAGQLELVIGIGINIRMTSKASSLIDQKWSDLSRTGSMPPGRNQLAAAVLDSLVQALDYYAVVGFGGFREQWHALDAFRDLAVQIHQGSEQVAGYERGVDANGALLLQVGDSVIAFQGGEVSLR